MTKLHAAALVYAKKGWKVFPCLPNGKKPASEHGFKDSTSDVDQINAWWTENPEYNIGIDCGGSGIVAIDFDEREAFVKLHALVGDLPPTPISITGSGRGGHLIFAQPTDGEPVTNATGGLPKKVDVRGVGGYICVFPSVHPSGGIYTWKVTPADCPPPPLPEKLLAVLRQAPERRNQLVQGKLLDGMGRNNYLFAYAIGLINKAMPDLEVMAKTAAENAVRCEPPLTNHELDTLIRSAIGYRGQTKAWLEKYGNTPTWRKISQAEIQQLDIPPTEWEVDKIMVKDAAPLMLFGEGGSYKSWIAMHMAACAATGEPVFGKFPVNQRGNSVFINFDSGAIPLIRRMKTLGGSRGNLSIVCPGVWNPIEFQKMMEANPESFVVLDCFSDIFEASDAYKQATEMRKGIKLLRDAYEKYRCEGIVIDHSKRGNAETSNPKDLFYGSNQKQATLRAMMHVGIVEPTEEKPLPLDIIRVKLTMVKQNEAEKLKPFEVDITFPNGLASFQYVEANLLPEECGTELPGQQGLGI